jgi:predicted HNH restriction endonuclease
MLEKTGCACEICGCNWVNPKSGKPIVEIHHIDGDAFNNKEDNLQVLCPNHHAMTETFKNNNEKGRSKRLKEK